MLKIDTHAHYLPRDWPDLARKYGDDCFPVIYYTEDGRHWMYKEGKFCREIWSKTWDAMCPAQMERQRRMTVAAPRPSGALLQQFMLAIATMTRASQVCNDRLKAFP